MSSGFADDFKRADDGILMQSAGQKLFLGQSVRKFQYIACSKQHVQQSCRVPLRYLSHKLTPALAELIGDGCSCGCSPVRGARPDRQVAEAVAPSHAQGRGSAAAATPCRCHSQIRPRSPHRCGQDRNPFRVRQNRTDPDAAHHSDGRLPRSQVRFG